MNRCVALAPLALLLFVLPFPGTVAFRLLCLAVAFTVASFSWRHTKPPVVPAVRYLLLWGVVAAFSLVYAVDPGYSAGEIKNEIGYALMTYLAFYVLCQDERALKTAIFGLLSGAFVVCVWAVLASAKAGYWEQSAGHGGTASFASYIAAVVPMLVLTAWGFGNIQWRVFAAALLLAVLAASFYSQQRIIWVVLLVQLVIALVFARKYGLLRVRAVSWLALLLIFVSLGVGALIGVQSARTQGSEFGAFGSDPRPAQWTAIAKRIGETPLQGAGFGRGALSKMHGDLTPKDAPLLWHAHNVFLNYGLAMGVPGILALVLVFWGLTRAYWQYLSGNSVMLRMLGVAGIMLVAGVIVRNQVNDMFVRDQALLFWALNGALLGLGERMLSRERGDE